MTKTNYRMKIKSGLRNSLDVFYNLAKSKINPGRSIRD